MLLGRACRFLSLMLVSLVPVRPAQADQCPQGFVDTLVSARGSGCAGMCGIQCWMVGASLSITGPLFNMFTDVVEAMTEEAKGEAMGQCEAALLEQWTAQAIRCNEICSASEPPCFAELSPVSWTPCEANCTASTVVCDPIGLLGNALRSGHPNKVKCDASGSAIVSCNCLGSAEQSMSPVNY